MNNEYAGNGLSPYIAYTWARLNSIKHRFAIALKYLNPRSEKSHSILETLVFHEYYMESYKMTENEEF